MLSVTLTLPSWTNDIKKKTEKALFLDNNSRMQFTLELQRRNIEEKTGGPFAACVFEQSSGKLISMGVNIVEHASCACAHAEVMAIMLANQTLKQYDLSTTDYQLVSSSQMCCMCYGALLWSGIKNVAFAATQQDIEIINGFDEGPLVSDWKQQLENRGIHLIENLQRDEAIINHQRYKALGGTVY